MLFTSAEDLRVRQTFRAATVTVDCYVSGLAADPRDRRSFSLWNGRLTQELLEDCTDSILGATAGMLANVSDHTGVVIPKSFSDFVFVSEDYFGRIGKPFALIIQRSDRKFYGAIAEKFSAIGFETKLFYQCEADKANRWSIAQIYAAY
jgi:hypothetical protein